jgi:RNA exonuclease 4
VTPVLAIDCEMVLMDSGDSEIARVSILNYNGHVIFDDYFRPDGRIKDFLTQFSGVDKWKIRNKKSYPDREDEIKKILNGHKIVGHTLYKDFQCLGIEYDEDIAIDISKFSKFKENGMTRALRKLTKDFVGIDIQMGHHSSIEDARAALLLFRKFENEILAENRAKKIKNKCKIEEIAKVEQNF